MSEHKIAFSVADGIARIVIDDAAHHNVVGAQFTREFARAAIACENDPAVRVVLLTANGKEFSVGGDLNEFLAVGDGLREHVREMAAWFHLGITVLNRLEVPVVCAVNGIAAGGGVSLALMCDLTVATRSARFNLAYTRSGLTPDGGASWFLPRLVGAQRAFDIMALNPTLPADEACAMGLIARVVDDADFTAEVERILQQLLAAPSQAIGRAKRLLRQSLSNSLEAQLELEGQSIAEKVSAPDTLAALQAFFAARRA
ncbi:MAG: enoyl-CoA hydratase/isomerase family protein [Gammaproteobacteria bacterium]|nr:enoyl-CoA hydratase/isomerase family protein [Gammaproteobacteria bacterium]MCP5198644.1 enoyl-CoA hydratase/isomerase family protein [Gammaproteobacteria bacterium]